MTTYSLMLYMLTILLILITARIALKWIKTADILRILCVEYLTQVWIHKGIPAGPDTVEAEIDARVEELKEEL